MCVLSAYIVNVVLLMPCISQEFHVGAEKTLGHRFAYYAKRVRILEITVLARALSISGPSYEEFSSALAGSPIFPALETLHVALRQIPGRGFVLKTLPQLKLPNTSLKTLTLEGSALREEEFYFGFLKPLAQSAPSQLKELTVKCGSTLEGPGPWGVIPTFQGLVSLSVCLPGCEDVPIDFVERLGEIPTLRELTLDIHFPHHKRPIGSRPSQEALFPSLKYFTLINRFPTGLCECFSVPSLLTHLTSFIFNFTYDTNDALSLVAERLGPISRATLKRIELMLPTPDYTPNTGLFTDEDVYPFLEHLDPEEIVLTQGKHLALSSDMDAVSTLHDLLRVLHDRRQPTQGSTNPPRTRLHTLRLTPDWWQGSIPLIRLGDVARICPELQHLTITIDSAAGSWPELDAVKSGPVPSQLRSLEISDMRPVAPGSARLFTTEEYKTVARFLDTCFPNLVELKFKERGFGPPTQRSEDWAMIDHLRSLYQELRLRFSS